ncbi:MAG TPA: DUF6496 domain-containing protein [Opitutaceae bacterium]|jgi:hypothetical protein|nr:DUF6496 domain-containing protein [Opitutaceae bacterium]
MPTATAKKRARADARQGKRPTTQAGEFVREEMRRYEEGSGTVKSRRQAVAIGLSEARRAGVKLPAPRSRGLRRRAARDRAIGQGRARVSPARSRGATQAARTRSRARG